MYKRQAQQAQQRNTQQSATPSATERAEENHEKSGHVSHVADVALFRQADVAAGANVAHGDPFACLKDERFRLAPADPWADLDIPADLDRRQKPEADKPPLHSVLPSRRGEAA